jgi:phage-related protein
MSFLKKITSGLRSPKDILQKKLTGASEHISSKIDSLHRSLSNNSQQLSAKVESLGNGLSNRVDKMSNDLSKHVDNVGHSMQTSPITEKVSHKADRIHSKVTNKFTDLGSRFGSNVDGQYFKKQSFKDFSVKDEHVDIELSDNSKKMCKVHISCDEARNIANMLKNQMDVADKKYDAILKNEISKIKNNSGTLANDLKSLEKLISDANQTKTLLQKAHDERNKERRAEIKDLSLSAFVYLKKDGESSPAVIKRLRPSEGLYDVEYSNGKKLTGLKMKELCIDKECDISEKSADTSVDVSSETSEDSSAGTPSVSETSS